MNRSSFAEQIKAHCVRLGTGQAARLCGVNRRTLQFWMAGKGRANKSTQVGALTILRSTISSFSAESDPMIIREKDRAKICPTDKTVLPNKPLRNRK